MFGWIREHLKAMMIVSVIALMVPVAFADTNMTEDMLAMMVEILPIMLIVMVFKMLATSMGGSN